MTLKLTEGDRFPVESLLPVPGGPSVVYFYPRDLTAGCTLQAKRFTELYPQFQELGYEVIGVSMDSQEKHAEFARECDIPFPLATDEEGELTRRLGILQEIEGYGAMPQRVTFLLDADGTILRLWQVEQGREPAGLNPDEVLGAIAAKNPAS
jgi:peroxiredoxin Q/BCP